MRALVLREHGGDGLRLETDFPDPVPGVGDVVLRVRATALNYHDVFTRRGMPGIRIAMPAIMGLDVAGEIAAIGPGVTGWKLGERVLGDPINRVEGGLTGETVHGGLAEYCRLRAHQLIAIPDSIGFAEAAAVQGARVLDHHAVSSIGTRSGRVTGVKVRGEGAVSCERIVVAAGNWTRDLLASLGPPLPVRYVRGDVAILRRPGDFGPPPKIHFDFYGNTYSRPEGEKDTLCGYMDTDPKKAARSHELVETLPAATVRDLRARLAKRFPRMAEAQPRGGWSGAYDVTPDSYPILDRFGPEGLFVAVGFSGHGFKLSPEVGRLLGEFVATGRRPEALEPLRVSRFDEGQLVQPDAPFPGRRRRRLP